MDLVSNSVITKTTISKLIRNNYEEKFENDYNYETKKGNEKI